MIAFATVACAAAGLLAMACGTPASGRSRALANTALPPSTDANLRTPVQLLDVQVRAYREYEQLAPDLIGLESWTAPAAGTRWSLVDRMGWLGDVEIVRVIERGCDHCATYQSATRLVAPLHRTIKGPTFAIGPVTDPLRFARVLDHNDAWWREWGKTQRDGNWITETAVDCDGDTTADLVRVATGASVRFEVRVRSRNGWETTQRWREPHVLDVDDPVPAIGTP
jgi:hypothetical protein